MSIPSTIRNIAVVSQAIRDASDPIIVRTQTAYGVGYIDALADLGFVNADQAKTMRDDIKVIATDD